MNDNRRNFTNPWPRLILAGLLTVWAGANFWSAIFRWSEIVGADAPNRGVGLLLSILFTLVPLVVAIYLFWTIVVGPDDPVAKGQRGRSAQSQRKP